MMQAQPTGMIQINYKKDRFDEINKKLNVEKYECPSIALTATALIWNDKKIPFHNLCLFALQFHAVLEHEKLHWDSRRSW